MLRPYFRWSVVMLGLFLGSPTQAAAAEVSVPTMEPRAGTMLIYRLADGRTSRWTCKGHHTTGTGRVAEFSVQTGTHEDVLRMVHTRDGIALAWQNPAQPGHWNPLVLDYLPARTSERWVARKPAGSDRGPRILGRLEQGEGEQVIDGQPLRYRKVSFHAEGAESLTLFTGWVHPAIGLLRIEEGENGSVRSELLHIIHSAG
ncbi:MAG: hypothetical protein VKO64_02065 [Candidatus Sericytochromatia bacterium]|nr:hypothetical protein [Candidatus Sericytochromatia bacterium]